MEEIKEMLRTSSELKKTKGYEEALSILEKAHLVAQPYALPHFYVHWKMFELAKEFRVWKEFLGQIPRLFLAIPGSLLGMAPKGNVGSTKMGIFESIREK